MTKYSTDEWLEGNDNKIDTADAEGNGYYDNVNLTYLNSATVTGTVRVGKLASSAAVSGITQPVTFTYISGSNGRYIGVFDKLLAIVANTTYWCHIDMVSGSNNSYRIKRIRVKSPEV